MNDHVLFLQISINAGLALCPPFFRKVDMEKGSLSTQKLIEKACGKKGRKKKKKESKKIRKEGKKEKERKACDPEETTVLRVSWENSEAYSLAPSNKPLKSCILFYYKQEAILLAFKKSSDICRSWEAKQRLLSTGI